MCVYMSKFKRWNCIMLANVLLLVGSALSLFNDFKMIMTGRFVCGLSVGIFSVYCPVFISETAPIEIKGPLGGLTQMSITLGVLIPFFFGTLYKETVQSQHGLRYDRDFIIFVFAFPFLMSFVQVLLLCTCYRTDTLTELKKEENINGLFKLNTKIFKCNVDVDPMIDRIEILEVEQLSYGKILANPQHRHSTFVGCTINVIKQLNGINIIILFSNNLFNDLSLSSETITFMIGITNFSASILGILLLFRVGRKKLMVTGNFFIAVSHFITGACLYLGYDIVVVTSVLLFLVFFEVSSGPVSWLYIAETMEDKAVSTANMINWLMNLAISFVIPLLQDAIGISNIGSIFLVIGAISLLGSIFLKFFMIETQGLSRQEIRQEYIRSMSSFKMTTSQRSSSLLCDTLPRRSEGPASRSPSTEQQ